MPDFLNRAEIEELSQFRLTTEKNASDQSIRLHELFDDYVLLKYLEWAGTYIGSPDVKVTASLFVKRYAILAVISLYAMTAWNKKINMSFQNISLQTQEGDKIWLPQFYFHQMSVETFCTERERFREEVIKDVFTNHMYVMISQISKVTKQSKQIFWENISIYLFWLYETAFTKIDDIEIEKRANEDYHYLINEAPGSLFGDCRENPLKKFYDNKKYEDQNGVEIRIRTTCCLNYRLEGPAIYCNTCPRKCRKADSKSKK
ncbi:IucA/IucC family C-terminal-domain containing protein [Niallia endozanthoxylica]|nr:IucA/IucC family C-terminal-domain containing protein [Niallia endozanthoxylica]